MVTVARRVVATAVTSVAAVRQTVPLRFQPFLIFPFHHFTILSAANLTHLVILFDIISDIIFHGPLIRIHQSRNLNYTFEGYPKVMILKTA